MKYFIQFHSCTSTFLGAENPGAVHLVELGWGVAWWAQSTGRAHLPVSVVWEKEKVCSEREEGNIAKDHTYCKDHRGQVDGLR